MRALADTVSFKDIQRFPWQIVLDISFLHSGFATAKKVTQLPAMFVKGTAAKASFKKNHWPFRHSARLDSRTLVRLDATRRVTSVPVTKNLMPAKKIVSDGGQGTRN